MPFPLRPAPGSPEELAIFADLQVRLRERFKRFRADPRQPYTAVIVPSQSFDARELAKISGVAHYEERLLVHLMLLRRPRLRVVFVSSKRIDPLVVDYYLHHMRGVPSEHARRRMRLLDCDDASTRPLTEKVLERPLLLQRIRDAIPDPEMAHLAVFNSTALERTLAVQLGIPLNACDPELSHLGTKTGGRAALRAAGVRVAPGAEGLRDTRDLVEGLADTWEACPDARRLVVKLDDSFSGEGNARLELAPLADAAPGRAGRAERTAALRAGLTGLQLEAEGLTPAGYLEQFDRMGGVCELWLEGRDKRSPSVQLRVNPIHEQQVVSTHDQLLGGATGQVFLGATFPADAAYRQPIQDAGRLVAAELAGRGVIGRFGVDFLVVPRADGAEPEITAVEINLRPGGTTHPFNMLKFLTDGKYDDAEGVFRTTQGRERCYVSTDNLTDPCYRGILPFDLIDRTVVEDMHMRSNETGVAFHLLGCLSEYGKVGCVAIARDLVEAGEMFEATRDLLDRMGGREPTRPRQK